MSLFRLFGKEKPASFSQFCEIVRVAARRSAPGATLQNTDDGFILTPPDGKPTNCNLRNLYATYSKRPGDKDALIKNYIDAALFVVPDQSWSEALLTLRPALKSSRYVAGAQAYLQKKGGDSLPAAPFAGDLAVILMRDLPGTSVAVTQKQFEDWGIGFEQAMRQALDNMNLLGFPPITNSLAAGKGSGETVGLVFEGDHLTATWLVLERFRDFLAMRLEGDYVVSIPHRNRLVAVRANEPGLIGSIQMSNRSYLNDTNSLTSQCFHISAAVTGGVVTVYQRSGEGAALDPHSPFAAGVGPAPTLPDRTSPVPTGTSAYRPPPVDLSAWGGLSETTDDAPPLQNDSQKGRR